MTHEILLTEPTKGVDLADLTLQIFLMEDSNCDGRNTELRNIIYRRLSFILIIDFIW